jgi:hypothetical protein
MRDDKSLPRLGQLFCKFIILLGANIFLGGCVNWAAAPQTSPFQATADYFECPEDSSSTDVQATLTNTTPYTMVVEPINQFTLYNGTYGHIVRRRPERFPLGSGDPITLAAGQATTIDVEGVGCGLCYLIGAQYTLLGEDETGVMYTDRFQVGNIYRSQCSLERVNAIRIPDAPPFSDLLITNNRPVWILPYCFPFPDLEMMTSATLLEYPYATLERQTTWGGWEVITPSQSICDHHPIYLSIPSGTNSVNVWKGTRFDWEGLTSGWYRWHIVYWDLEPYWRNDGGLSLGANYHYFSEAFFVKP